MNKMRMMNKMNAIHKINRKGMWMQVFLISFFVILIIFCIILLSVDINRGNLESKRKYVEEDLLDTRANAALINILRSPVEIDGKTQTFANAISTNDGKNDKQILDALEKRFNGLIVGDIMINYPSRTISLEFDGIVLRDSYNKQVKTCYYNKSVALSIVETKIPGSQNNIDIILRYCEADYSTPIKYKQSIGAGKLELPSTGSKGTSAPAGGGPAPMQPVTGQTK